MYLFNFVSNQCFIVISADLRTEPVFAYSGSGSIMGSVTGTFDSLPRDSCIFGVYGWFTTTAAYVKNLRDSLADSDFVDGTILTYWKELKKTTPVCEKTCDNYPCCFAEPRIGCDDLPCELKVSGELPEGTCNTVIMNKGPLLNTKWGQGNGYNNNYTSCSGCSGNMPSDGKFWTGCEATAAAQVMKYYGQPSASFNFGSMADDFSSGDCPDLMWFLANTVNMDLECGGSSAYTSDTRNALVNSFGYSSDATYEDYPHHYADLKSNLDLNRPVIMDGDELSGTTFLGFPKYDNGHCWVCDGYTVYQKCAHGGTFYHMNWGWDGTADGWYGTEGFNPLGHAFNYNNYMIVNIHR